MTSKLGNFCAKNTLYFTRENGALHHGARKEWSTLLSEKLNGEYCQGVPIPNEKIIVVLSCTKEILNCGAALESQTDQDLICREDKKLIGGRQTSKHC